MPLAAELTEESIPRIAFDYSVDVNVLLPFEGMIFIRHTLAWSPYSILEFDDFERKYEYADNNFKTGRYYRSCRARLPAG